MTAAASVDLDVPVEEAWRAVTDWTGQGSWMPMTVVEVVSGDGGLGTLLRARTGAGPAAVVDDMTIDVFEPPLRAEVAHHGRVVTGRGVFLVEPRAGGGSRVTWSEEPAPGSFAARLSAVSDPFTRAALGVALRRLRRVVEGRPRASRP